MSAGASDVSGLLVLIIAHIIYWPQILQLWTWIPLIQFPASVSYNGGGAHLWAPEISTASRGLPAVQLYIDLSAEGHLKTRFNKRAQLGRAVLLKTDFIFLQ